jgi:hypothetical protein
VLLSRWLVVSSLSKPNAREFQVLIAQFISSFVLRDPLTTDYRLPTI